MPHSSKGELLEYHKNNSSMAAYYAVFGYDRPAEPKCTPAQMQWMAEEMQRKHIAHQAYERLHAIAGRDYERLHAMVGREYEHAQAMAGREYEGRSRQRER